jgi:hypothetical protein
MEWTRFQEQTVIFALGHACLGCLLATLAAILLHRHSPALRCWIWRLGLLKGPLALILAVPVAVLAPAPAALVEAPLTTSQIAAPVNLTNLGPVVVAAAEPINPWPYLYTLGVLAALIYRFSGHPRTDPRMPRVEGVLRPRVVVPDDLAPHVAEMALAHEKAHMRRRDPQWSFVADLVCAAFWFAPPVWICARNMRAEAEAACDAEALRATGAAKRAYAELLLSFAGPAPANALGGPARRLSRRILMLEKTPRYLPRLSAAALIATGLFTLVPWRAEAQSATAAPKPPAKPQTSNTAQIERELRAVKAERAAMRAQLANMRRELSRVQAEATAARAQKRTRESERRRRADAERYAVNRMIVAKEMRESAAKADRDTVKALLEAERAKMNREVGAMDRKRVELERKMAKELAEKSSADAMKTAMDTERVKMDRERSSVDRKRANVEAERARDADQRRKTELRRRIDRRGKTIRAIGATGRIEAPNGKGEGESEVTSRNITIDGKSLDDLPTPANPLDPIKVWTEGDYTVRVYRKGDKAANTYRISRTLTKEVKKGG